MKRKLPGAHLTDEPGAGVDSYYRKVRLSHKKRAKWCSGKPGTGVRKPGVVHQYQPHDPYPWVKDGKAQYDSIFGSKLELPWDMYFEKCQACGRCNIRTVRRQHDPVKREQDWELTKKITKFEEEGEEEV